MWNTSWKFSKSNHIHWTPLNTKLHDFELDDQWPMFLGLRTRDDLWPMFLGLRTRNDLWPMFLGLKTGDDLWPMFLGLRTGDDLGMTWWWPGMTCCWPGDPCCAWGSGLMTHQFFVPFFFFSPMLWQLWCHSDAWPLLTNHWGWNNQEICRTYWRHDPAVKRRTKQKSLWTDHFQKVFCWGTFTYLHQFSC